MIQVSHHMTKCMSPYLSDVSPVCLHNSLLPSSSSDTKMKKFSTHILRKCKSLSRNLSRSSLSSNTRTGSSLKYSKSSREGTWSKLDILDYGEAAVYVGSSRRKYVIDSKYLSHPLINALIEKSSPQNGGDMNISIKCEVVLFDHVIWMLENGDPCLSSESLEELAELYVSS